MIYKELLNSGADIALFGELLLSMLTLIYGKMECLDVMYMARRLGTRSDYRPSPLEYMKEGRYDAEYAKFKNCLATHLSKNSKLNAEESEKIIDKAMSLYLKQEYSPSLKQIVRSKAEKNALSKGLYECAGFLYRLIKGRNLTHKYNFLLEYKDDFDKIKEQIIKFSI